MTVDEAVEVVRVVVAELVAAGARIDPSELDGIQRRLARALWSALDQPSRLQVIEEGVRQGLAEGRAVLVVDDAGSVRVWDGEES